MAVSTVLLSAFLILVWLDASLRLRPTVRRKPAATLTVCAVLIPCLAAQLQHPELLVLFQRSAPQIANGEWWRLGTALFFQDGWLIGGASNLLWLLAIGTLTEQVRTRANWTIIYVAGALAGELVALRWQPTGAGNSIATCSLAGSLLSLGPWRTAPLASKVLKTTALIICVVLITRRDIHGAAAVAGIVVGFARPRLDDRN